MQTYIILIAFSEQADGKHESKGANSSDGTDAGDDGYGLQDCIHQEDHIRQPQELQEDGLGKEGDHVVLGRVDTVAEELLVKATQADATRFVRHLRKK
jgi:hypothetical protein